MLVLVSIITIIGASGLLAQVLFMRELMVSFYGNELTLGIVLANWLAAEALGVFIAGRFIGRLRNKIAVFSSLELAFCAALPVSIFCARAYKSLMPIAPGEGVGLPVIYVASLIIILPVAFTHGALFSSSCDLFSWLQREKKTDAAILAGIYAWETIGTVAGGILVTYFFFPYLNVFTIIWVVVILNLAGLSFLLYSVRKIKAAVAVACALILCLLAARGNLLQRIEDTSARMQFRTGRLLEYRNSVYGAIAVTKQQEQYTFFLNGIPAITTPHPDSLFTEDFAHIPLLLQKDPKDILVLGAGAGGLIREILKHPVTAIDYVEMDPLLITMLRKYPTPLSAAELGSPRVRVITTDGRFFVGSADKSYDTVFIGLPVSGELAANRFFTTEFFELLKAHLNPGGLVALWMPGSLTFISPERAGLNALIIKSLQSVFGNVRIIPGDYNIYCASDDPRLLRIQGSDVARAFRESGIETAIVSPPYLEYRLQPYFLEWFQKSVDPAKAQLNRDYEPRAVFKTLVIWNKEFSPRLFPVLKKIESLRLYVPVLLIIVLTLGVFRIISARRSKRGMLAWAIGTTGFFGMMSSLILVFGFQVFYGYLYRYIGMLIAVFMAGGAGGSLVMNRRMETIRTPMNTLMAVEAAMLVFCGLVAVILPLLGSISFIAGAVFLLFFLTAGCLIGLEFALAGKIYGGPAGGVGETAGILYFADLAGGWFAGMLGGVVLVPVFGIIGTCALMALLKAGSLVIITRARYWKVE